MHIGHDRHVLHIIGARDAFDRRGHVIGQRFDEPVPDGGKVAHGFTSVASATRKVRSGTRRRFTAAAISARSFPLTRWSRSRICSTPASWQPAGCETVTSKRDE